MVNGNFISLSHSLLIICRIILILVKDVDFLRNSFILIYTILGGCNKICDAAMICHKIW